MKEKILKKSLRPLLATSVTVLAVAQLATSALSAPTLLSPTLSSAEASQQTASKQTASQQSAARYPAIKADTDDVDLVMVPGTSVSLSPPPDFILSEQFSGFVNPDDFSSIVLTEMPQAAYGELADIFSSSPEAITAAFAERGITLDVETVSDIQIGEIQTSLVSGTQQVDGLVIDKYFTLLGEESTVLLTFNVIAPSQLSEADVIQTIQSIELNSPPSVEEKAAELPFTFEVAEPFQIFDVLAGSAVLLSPNGEPDPSGEAPLVIIASSLSAVVVSDQAAFAAQLLQQTDGFVDVNITDNSPVTFADGEGYLTQATRQDTTVFQYLRILPDGYYIRLVVTGNSTDLDAVMPAIQSIQSSVSVRE